MTGVFYSHFNKVRKALGVMGASILIKLLCILRNSIEQVKSSGYCHDEKLKEKTRDE
jgi:hypothetical protein